MTVQKSARPRLRPGSGQVCQALSECSQSLATARAGEEDVLTSIRPLLMCALSVYKCLMSGVWCLCGGMRSNLVVSVFAQCWPGPR